MIRTYLVRFLRGDVISVAAGSKGQAYRLCVQQNPHMTTWDLHSVTLGPMNVEDEIDSRLAKTQGNYRPEEDT